MKLYHYVHCPFCVRVRMALGYLQIPFESQVVAYDDEKTPVALTGKKMLPIMDMGNGKIQNESLDIINILDPQNLLQKEHYQNQAPLLETLLNEIGSPVHNLAMPYWIWTPEFNDSSRKYFVEKKSVKRGPFNQLVQKQDQYIKQLNLLFAEKIENHLKPFYQSDKLTLTDIVIAAHLWGVYVVPEYQLPKALDEYLKRVKKECRFNYHEDFWR
jgi:glutaredoxin 2